MQFVGTSGMQSRSRRAFPLAGPFVIHAVDPFSRGSMSAQLACGKDDPPNRECFHGPMRLVWIGYWVNGSKRCGAAMKGTDSRWSAGEPPTTKRFQGGQGRNEGNVRMQLGVCQRMGKCVSTQRNRRRGGRRRGSSTKRVVWMSVDVPFGNGGAERNVRGVDSHDTRPFSGYEDIPMAPGHAIRLVD